ncbi:hypothetical protein J4414_04145 [Candidatus Woesearchaeota archaeon]|nr:hypothetical protein [Candidatus Woesearchaeota archaeon]
MAQNSEQRYLDVMEIYTTPFEIEALELMKKYRVDYMIINEKIKEIYKIKEVSYIKDEKCFKEVFNNVYEILC